MRRNRSEKAARDDEGAATLPSASKSEASPLRGSTRRSPAGENAVDLDVTSDDARLELRGALDEPLESLKLASRLRLAGDIGWLEALDPAVHPGKRCGTPAVERIGDGGREARRLRRSTCAARVAKADIEKLQKIFRHRASSVPSVRTRDALRPGEIENAKFDLKSTLDAAASEKTAPAFKGTLGTSRCEACRRRTMAGCRRCRCTRDVERSPHAHQRRFRQRGRLPGVRGAGAVVDR